MQILGLEIRRVGKEEPSPKATQAVHVAMGVGIERYIPLTVLTEQQRSVFTDAIIWPPCHMLDGFAQVQYDKLVNDIVKNVAARAHFSICPVRELRDLGCYTLTPETEVIFEQLRHLHCVNYENIPPDIIEQMPAMLSAIFTEGRSIRDITGDVIREKPLLGHDKDP